MMETATDYLRIGLFVGHVLAVMGCGSKYTNPASLPSDTVVLTVPSWPATVYFAEVEVDSADYSSNALRIVGVNGQLLYEARCSSMEPIYAVSVWGPGFRDKDWTASPTFVVYRQSLYGSAGHHEVTVLCHDAGQVAPCFSTMEWDNHPGVGSVSSSRSHVSFSSNKITRSGSPEITLFRRFYSRQQYFIDPTPSPVSESYTGKPTIETYRWSEEEKTFVLFPEELTETVE